MLETSILLVNKKHKTNKTTCIHSAFLPVTVCNVFYYLVCMCLVLPFKLLVFDNPVKSLIQHSRIVL